MIELGGLLDYTRALRKTFNARGVIQPAGLEVVSPVLPMGPREPEPFGIARRIIYTSETTVGIAGTKKVGFCPPVGTLAIVRSVVLSVASSGTVARASIFRAGLTLPLPADANGSQVEVSNDVSLATTYPTGPLALFGDTVVISANEPDNYRTYNTGGGLSSPSLDIAVYGAVILGGTVQAGIVFQFQQPAVAVLHAVTAVIDLFPNPSV